MKLAFFAVLIVFLVLPIAQASVGIGISDYDSKTIVTGPVSIKVGKVVNTGNETLIFFYFWNQTSSTANITLPVITGPNVTVDSGMSFEPIITIVRYNASYAGNYSGIVQIKGTYQLQGGTNMIFPSGQVHVSLTVYDPPSQQDYTSLITGAVIAGCIIALCIVIVVWVWKRNLK